MDIDLFPLWVFPNELLKINFHIFPLLLLFPQKLKLLKNILKNINPLNGDNV